MSSKVTMRFTAVSLDGLTLASWLWRSSSWTCNRCSLPLMRVGLLLLRLVSLYGTPPFDLGASSGCLQGFDAFLVSVEG